MSNIRSKFDQIYDEAFKRAESQVSTDHPMFMIVFERIFSQMLMQSSDEIEFDDSNFGGLE